MPEFSTAAFAMVALALAILAIVIARSAWRRSTDAPPATGGCSSGLCGAPRRRVRLDTHERDARAGCPVREQRVPDPDPSDDYEERRERYEATQRRGRDHLRAKRDKLAYLSGASRREYDPERERLLHGAAIRQYALDLPDYRRKDRYTRKLYPTGGP